MKFDYFLKLKTEEGRFRSIQEKAKDYYKMYEKEKAEVLKLEKIVEDDVASGV